MSPKPTNPTNPATANPVLPEPETAAKFPGTEDDGGECLLGGTSREERSPTMPDEIEEQSRPIDPAL